MRTVAVYAHPSVLCERWLTYIQSYNAENRINGVVLTSGDCDTLPLIDQIKLWAFTYDGDGNKVKQVYTDTSNSSSLTTYYYAGGSYEVQTDDDNNTVVRQYYSIAGVSVGLSIDGERSYYLTDQLGSISVVTDDTGTITSETRYTPFGEVRTDVGVIDETNYGYTNQEVVSYIKLMFYRSRWYSPELGRFVQPDSIVAEPGSSQGYNRYAYVKNNPIRYTDPSGFIYYDSDDYVKVNPYLYKIQNEFGWTVSDEDWTGAELYTLYYAGAKIQEYVDQITGGKGNEWMRKYLGGTYFVRGHFPGKPEYSYTSGSTIHLSATWTEEKEGWKNIIHELGHVYDNNSQSDFYQNMTSGCDATICGGGNADKLIYAIGGIPMGLRFYNGLLGVPIKYRWDVKYNKTDYGNTATAEYFAEAFEYMIVDPGRIPQSEEIISIIQGYIESETAAIP